MADAINPSHYRQGKVECIDALESATVNKTGLEAVCVANVIKYLWRYEAKNGLEDIRKAQWYLAKLIDYLEHKDKIDEMIAKSDVETPMLAVKTDCLPIKTLFNKKEN